MSDWTPELKQEVIEAYKAQNPTAETTTQICEELADKYGKTVNGLRLILSKGDVYIATSAKTSTASADSGDKPKRKSKQDSLDELGALLVEHGVTVDDSVVGKLTGKAAEYFIGAFKHILEN
jgi:hypothetical protein